MEQSSEWIVIPHMNSMFTENNLVDNRMLAAESNVLHSIRSTTIEMEKKRKAIPCGACAPTQLFGRRWINMTMMTRTRQLGQLCLFL